VVYWDLAAADLAGDGHCNLDMSGVPSTSALVAVSGQIQGATDTDPTTPFPARANLQFSSIRLDGADGLTAAFTRSVMTDDAGNYSTKLFPGLYRVVILPASGPDVVPPSTSDPSLTGAATIPWAIDEEKWTITSSPLAGLNAILRPKRSVTG